MPPVTVIILHAEAGARAGPLERGLARARATAGATLRGSFERLGAGRVEFVAGAPDGLPFGRRLARLLPAEGGLVVLGAGSVPLAMDPDLARFLSIAGSGERLALANNCFSADVVAIARTGELPPLPDLPGDNALPRWLAEVAGWRVADLRAHWRLQVDLDSPLDVLLVGTDDGVGGVAGDDPAAAVRERLAGVRRVLADRRAEVVVAGRSSAASLRWLERHAAARVRALVEERGLRASTPLAQEPEPVVATAELARRRRPPRSVLGLLLDREGPGRLGGVLAELGDGALVDTRVLLAHRLGADERGWPSAEDRFASDMLRPGSIADPWLRELTAAALDAPVPVLLGGHSLVGPGVRLVLPAAGRPASPAAR